MLALETFGSARRLVLCCCELDLERVVPVRRPRPVLGPICLDHRHLPLAQEFEKLEGDRPPPAQTVQVVDHQGGDVVVSDSFKHGEEGGTRLGVAPG